MFLSGKKKRRIDVEAVEKETSREPLELEKGDLLAMMLSAFIVFTPFVIGISAALFFAWWLFIGRF